VRRSAEEDAIDTRKDGSIFSGHADTKFANRAQAAAGITLDVTDWLKLEQLTHGVAALSDLATAVDASPVDIQCWRAMASGTPDTQFAQQFELLVAGMLDGKFKVNPSAPAEVKYLLSRALRVARPWPVPPQN
jgi:hypothetical protein